MGLNQGYGGKCYTTNKVVIEGKIEDFYREMISLGFTEGEMKTFRADRKTYACFPIPSHDGGKPLGVLSLDAKTPELFTVADIEVLETFLPLYSRLVAGRVGQEGDAA